MSFPDNEPAITAGSISALVAAVIALLAAFGLPITTEQREAIIGLVVVVAPLAVALLVRPQVTPNKRADARVMAAVETMVSVAAPRTRPDPPLPH